MLEHIVTDVKVKQDKLFLHIRGVGDIYFDWEHTFPTRILNKFERQELEKELKNHPELAKHPSKRGGERRKQKKEQIFPHLHLKIPLYKKDILKEEFPTNKYSSRKSSEKKESIFIMGGYTLQAQRRFITPSTIVNVEKKVLEAIVLTNKFNKEIKQLKKRIGEEIEGRGKAYHTRVFNELEKQFSLDISGQERNKLVQENTYTQNLTESLNDKRKRTMTTHNKLLKQIDSLEARIEKNEDKTYKLVLNETNSITPLRSISYLEVMKEKWLSFDIEIPLWKNEREAKISWVGMDYSYRGKERKEMHTLHNLGRKKHKYYHIYTYDNEQELVKGIANSIQRQNPLVITAYNYKFDILNLREAGEFNIGSNEKRPYQDVSISFFERLDLEGRILIDLLRWAQIVYDYLPNRKLELVSRTTLPNLLFTKSLTYNQMAAKELITMNHPDPKVRVEKAREIADYLVGDVDIMPKIIKSEEFQTSLRFACEFAKSYKLPFAHFLYSQRTINKVQERSYEHFVGIPRDKVLYRTKKSREDVSKAKQDFRRLLGEKANPQSEPGVYENIHLAYLKYGYALRHVITDRLPEAEILYSQKPATGFENNLLGRYGNSLAEWITSDFTILKKLEKSMFEHIDKLESGHMKFFEVYSGQRYIFEKEKKTKRQFHTSTITTKSLMENMRVKTKIFLEKNNIEPEYLVFLLNKYRKYQKFQKRFRGQYDVSEEVVEKILDQQIDDAKKFAENYGLRLIHQRGPYLYFQGDGTQAIKDHPAVFVKNIDKVLITKKYAPRKDNQWGDSNIFYDTHGVYRGLKLVDHGTHNMNLFEQQTKGYFIKELLNNNPQEAAEILEKQTERLWKGEIDYKELVWYANGKDRYSAFVNGKKICFHKLIPKEINKAELLGNIETKRMCYLETIRNKEEEVLIMRPEEVEFDLNMYWEKHKKDIKNLAHNFIGEEIFKLFPDETDGSLFSNYNVNLATTSLKERYY